MSSDETEKKPVPKSKSSMEILSELFGTFDAEPPVIVKREEKENHKRHKKSKKKHKKHKKKKKRKRDASASSSGSDNSAVDLTDLLASQDTKLGLDEALQKIIKAEVVVKKEEEEASVRVEKKVEDGRSSRKHKSKVDKERKRHRSRSRSREKHKQHKDSSPDYKYRCGDLREKIKSKYSDEYRYKDDYKYHDEYRYKDDRSYRSKPYAETRRPRHRHNSFYDGDDSYYCSREDRYKHTDRDKYRESESENHIDKKKLLEIARKNAIQMMKSGSLPVALTLGPQAQEKVIAAIKSGGKTVEELTDFCKTLSRKEELGELSSISDDDGSESDGQPFHHPFLIKDRPLTINIKNSIAIPIKTNQERASELRIQFPVSSGQQHRKTESGWVPVEPTKKSAKPVAAPVASIVAPFVPPLPVEPPPQPQYAAVQEPATYAPSVYTAGDMQSNVDIASVVSQRLTAIRKLQENPNDVQAIGQMYKAQKEMNTWAESKQQPGQFTGSTGAQILSQAELSSGFQAWARKDQLQTATPVSGGMGMHLLQKMGWKPGEGLGKEKTGALEPLLLEVKLDKKGIVAKEEQKKKVVRVVKQQQQQQQQQQVATKTLQGKHPVSLLGEYASKKKLGAPQYIIDSECGPDHKKVFLFKVVFNGAEFKPNMVSGNKKEAKALAAIICLQQLGLIPA